MLVFRSVGLGRRKSRTLFRMKSQFLACVFLSELFCGPLLAKRIGPPVLTFMAKVDQDDEAGQATLPSHFAGRFGYNPGARRSRRTAEAEPAKVRKRIKRTRDDPSNSSLYAHLSGVPDILAPSLDILFCGINPGVQSATAGHHFAHRSNHFYPALSSAGITSQRISPEQDTSFPSLEPFALGLTNLAGRPTAEGSELMPSELIDGVPLLLDKLVQYKPRTVCFVGKGISQAFLKGLQQAQRIPKDLGNNTAHALNVSVPASVLQSAAPAPSSPSKRKRYTKGNSKDDAGYGLMPVCFPHSGVATRQEDVTLFFVCPSTSARVTTHFLDDKARVLSSLRILVHHLQQPVTANLPFPLALVDLTIIRTG